MNISEAKMNEVKITNEKGTTRTSVEIDGVKLQWLKSFELKQEAGKFPVLKLEFYSESISVDGKAVLEQEYVEE